MKTTRLTTMINLNFRQVGEVKYSFDKNSDKLRVGDKVLVSWCADAEDVVDYEINVITKIKKPFSENLSGEYVYCFARYYRSEYIFGAATLEKLPKRKDKRQAKLFQWLMEGKIAHV